jgi:outer membrane protein OmpA-like peptidoglycan-associated protein
MPIYNVHFSVGSAELSPDAMKTLTSAVDYLRSYPAVRVSLTGYTDLLGSAATNMKLAEQRVASAAQYLEERGIDHARIAMVAVGEADAALVPSGENPTTWNRRVAVEFSVSPSS